MNPTPSQPSEPDQPSWGTAPSNPPTGSGTSTESGTDSSQQPRPGQPGARFFDAVRELGVVRPDDSRWAAGVAAGLARRWNLDPLAVRAGFFLLTLLGGLGVALYGLGWLLLPHPDGRIHAQQVLNGTVTPGFIGAALTVLVGGPEFHGTLLLLALIGFIAWRITGRHRHHQYQDC
jgi:phage shock protein PspC (stress-responsive transcriptional regulator)